MAEFTPQEIEQFLQQFFDVVGARQYVGARYVPIFGRAGSDTVEWDNLEPYEPLTVVLHQGVSYVSRRYVPAGIPITDTGYWVETYRFNAQVEQYRQEVLTFQGQIDEIRDEVSSDYVPFPNAAHYPKFGTVGQVLGTLGDGGTIWSDPVIVTSEIAAPLIEDWLDEHPEATTTVQDGSISPAKFQAGAPFKPNVSYTDNNSANLDEITTPGIYQFIYNSGLQWDASFPEQQSGNLIVTAKSGIVWQLYYASQTGNVHTRLKAGDTWRAWTNATGALEQAIEGDFASGRPFKPPVSYTYNQSVDLNTLTVPGVYPIQYDSSAGAYNATFPANDYGSVYVTNSKVNGYVYQLFVTQNTGTVFTRLYAGGTWRAWNSYAKTLDTELHNGRAFRAPITITPDQSTDFDELTTPGAYATIYNPNSGDYSASWPEQISGTLYVTAYGTIVYQTYITRTGHVYSRYYGTSWSAWESTWKSYVEEHEISILFVGNSLTADAIAYLPWLLKTFYPDVRFRFYNWYNGGYTLAMQYADFNNDVACQQFSVAENVAHWTNTNNSVTIDTVLSTYQFDIVCMQEYFNYKTEYTTADLVDWNNCRDYIASNYTGTNALEFISLFHAPKRDVAASVFALTETGNALILRDTIAQDMIPVGMAVYRALDTSLDDLGDAGHLSVDGTHTQEGLPCLLQSFVACLWMLERYGINESVYRSPARMTTTIYNTLNVPSPNLGTGVITGTTAQNLLAQEVAIKAYKEGRKFVADNLSEY